MRPPPPALARAGPLRSENLLGLLALASRICRLAADIEKLDRAPSRVRTAPSFRRFVRSYGASRASLLPCDFSCPSTSSSISRTSNASLASSSPNCRVAVPQHCIGSLSPPLAHPKPSSALSQTRNASTAAAAAKLADPRIDKQADHAPYSPLAASGAADLPWQQPPDIAVHSVSPEAGPSSRPSHWIAPWQDRENATPEDFSLNLRLDKAVADQSKEFVQGWKTGSDMNRLTLRRVLAHRLWHLYQQHAHKETLSMHNRISVANSLATAAIRITTNKSNSTQSKALRFLFGQRIYAIIQDCHIILAKAQAASKKSLPVKLSHSNLSLALLQPISVALRAQPIKALKLLDEVLLRCRPDIYRYKTNFDSLTPNDHLLPINLTLRTIIDSINFQIHCRPEAEDLANSVMSQPQFFEDTDMLEDLRDGRIQLLESSDPIRDSLEWYMASPHAFLLSNSAFNSTRGLFLHCISQTQNAHRILEELSRGREPEEPAFIQACDFLLRSVLLHKGSEAALELYDDLWSRGVDVKPRLIFRLTKASRGKGPSPRLEMLLHREGPAKRKSHRQKRIRTKVLQAIALNWAIRNRPDRLQILLSQLNRQQVNDDFTRRAMLELAAASGDIRSLHEKLAEIHDFKALQVDECAADKKPLDGRAYGLLIKSCNRVDDVDLAEFYLTQALERGIVVRTSDFNFLVDLYIRRYNIDAALAIFEQMNEFGVQPDRYTYTILMHGFALRRDPDSAAHALRAMIAAGLIPDRITYCALLHCFVESGLYEAAIKLFAWMQKHGDVRLRPTIEVCNIILKAYVLSSLPVQKVMQFVRNVRKMGLVPNSNTYALMMQSACDAGLMDIAEEVFSEAEGALPDVTGSGGGHGANIYHFTIMIHGYLRLGDYEEAKDYFDELQDRKLAPSAITWSVMVHSYAHSENEANYDRACTLVSQLIADENKNAFKLSSWDSHANTAEKNRNQKAAEKRGGKSRLANKYNPPFETLYTVLMVAQARRGEPEQVEKTLRLLSRHPSDLSVYAITPLLDAYRRAGDVDNALHLFDQIYEIALKTASSKSYRVYAHSPSETSADDSDASSVQVSTKRRQDASSRNLLCLPVSIMIDLLSTAGRHEEIAKIWARAKKDGFGFDSDNWNHLAASMARDGQLDEALSVVEHVLNRNPPSAWGRSSATPHLRKSATAISTVEGEADKLASRLGDAQIDGSDDRLQEELDFDPLPADALLDPAVAYRSDATSPPSTPPNRRHESRSEDDPFVELPFDRSKSMASVGEEGTDGEGLALVPEATEEEDYTEPGALFLDPRSNISLTRDLESSASRFSPWYAHFETMEAISRGLADITQAPKVIELLDKYRVAARLLNLHERKIEIIRERQREAAVRSARDLIDGRA